MKNPSFSLIAALIVVVLFGFSACLKDDDDGVDPGNEQEVITTVQLTFTPSAGGTSLVYEFTDPDGPGGQAPVVDQVLLPSGSTFELSVEFIDRSNPSSPDFITGEVQDEAEEHLVCYAITGTAPVITVKDHDTNGDPLGLVADVQTAAAGSGSLTVSLKHEANKDAAAPCTTGETDVEAEFAVLIN